MLAERTPHDRVSRSFDHQKMLILLVVAFFHCTAICPGGGFNGVIFASRWFLLGGVAWMRSRNVALTGRIESAWRLAFLIFAGTRVLTMGLAVSFIELTTVLEHGSFCSVHVAEVTLGSFPRRMASWSHCDDGDAIDLLYAFCGRKPNKTMQSSPTLTTSGSDSF